MKSLPNTSNCVLELSDNWLTIWFDRPEKRNALSKGLINDIELTLLSVYENQLIRGIIFRGKGDVFCAGADLNEMKNISSLGSEARDLAIEMSERIGNLFKTISKAPQITVAAVHGAAIAGAFGIACATDFLITTSKAKYSLTETKIGLTPAQIAPYVINRLGFTNARKLMILGTLFDGEKAFKIGMADYLADTNDEFEQNIIDLKTEVNKCAPNAVSITKKIILDNYAVISKNAAELFADSIVNGEGIEGLNSFFEKRKPNWSL